MNRFNGYSPHETSDIKKIHKDWDNQNEIFPSFINFLMEKEFDVKGTTLAKIVDNFTTLNEIYKNKSSLNSITDKEGKKLFKGVRKKTLIKIEKALNCLDTSKSIRENYLQSIGRYFIKRQVKNINSLNLNHINPNPFLIVALNLNDYKKAIELLVFARITRSIVTSFGTSFEHILMAVGAEPIKKRSKSEEKGQESKFDAKKEINGVLYHFQCKSGTSDMNKDMIQSWKKKIEKEEIENPRDKYFIGMPYGKRESDAISVQLIKKYFKEGYIKNTLIGKELWYTLTSDNKFHKILMNELEVSAFSVLKNDTIMKLIKKKTQIITQEFEQKYGIDKIALNTYFDDQF